MFLASKASPHEGVRVRRDISSSVSDLPGSGLVIPSVSGLGMRTCCCYCSQPEGGWMGGSGMTNDQHNESSEHRSVVVVIVWGAFFRWGLGIVQLRFVDVACRLCILTTMFRRPSRSTILKGSNEY